jgi:uncharacterized membrane protein (DUF2068 family)
MPKTLRGGLLLRTIAVLKFLKAALLIAAGIGALHLVKRDIAEYAENLVVKYHLNPGNHFVAQALARTSNVTPRRLHEVGAVAFVYAALFLLEGIGLWSLKRWGEWVTVVITGSLLPFEVYELWHHPSWPKTVVLILNALILGYLIRRLRKG